ncbi:exocyst complex component EXO70B1-like [Salvia hispanica]|uniref:exocyst complex component EXO70B1-like n=1 Tax=Salvia hispanica TaxID=49212 RepID=UPI0020098513|nr:exocyst complex component EXO70B1-like [Salvia hispanica]
MDSDNPKPENDSEEGKAEINGAESKSTDEEKPAKTADEENKEGGEGAAAAVESEAKEGEEDPPPPPSALNIDKLSQEVDGYLATLSAPKPEDGGGESSLPQDVPNFVKQFSLMVEARVADYDSSDESVKWGSVPEEESASFLDAITRLSSLSTALLAYSAQPNIARSINRISAVIEQAMSYVEEEFKDLLDEHRFPDSNPPQNGGEGTAGEVAVVPPSEEEVAPEQQAPPPSKEDNNFPGYEDEVLSNLIRLSKLMTVTEYDTECREAYFVARRVALDAALHKLGFEKHSIDDVHKMQWETLETEIISWIRIFKHCPSLLASEGSLTRAVFPERPAMSGHLHLALTQCVSAAVLNFAGAVALTKSSSEKLFKFLDMYEALRDVIPALGGEDVPQDWRNDLNTESSIIRCRLGEAITSMFSELETSIRTDAGKTPVPGGAIHPLTRYTMNYIKLACEYKETLEHIFKEHHHREESGSGSGSNSSPFAAHMIKIMELLDENMEAKSKLYKDHALGAIFLMNNGRYVLQKVRGSNEIGSLIGDVYSRKKSSDLRQYHKVYQRETWGKLLSYLHPDGLTSHGKVSKPVLKERFKNFNAMFDEISRTQTTWVVCDEQLQSELRVSISNMVVPAYRSFLGRYNQVFTAGRQTEKYVKYQGEDVENSIEELFDGKK